MRVLHLDSDGPSRRDLAAELEAAGHRVEPAQAMADALALDAAHPFDLIVTEARLADGGVLDLLRRLHRSRSGRLPPIAVLASQADPGLPELCERAGVRRFLRKEDGWPVNAAELHGLLAEMEPPKAQGVPPASPASSRVFRGSLDSVDLVEVIQLLNLGRKSGSLLLFGGSREGRLHLHEGDVVAAACGASSGVDAFRALLGARGGTFRFEVGDAPIARTIHDPTTGLLLDALRQEDEDGRGVNAEPGLNGGEPGVIHFPDEIPDGAFALEETSSPERRTMPASPATAPASSAAVPASPAAVPAERHEPPSAPASAPAPVSGGSSRAAVQPLRLVPDVTMRRASRRRRPAFSRVWLFAGGAAAALAAGYAVHTAGTRSSRPAPELEREDVRTLLLEAAEDQARIDSLEAFVQELLKASSQGPRAGH